MSDPFESAIDGLTRLTIALDAQPDALAAWEARVLRMNEGCATGQDIALHEMARRAALQGVPIPPEACALPSLPPKPPGEERELDRALGFGIPAVFVREVIATGYRETMATQACGLVRAGHLSMLVLTGERGGGKSFAAARWLLRAPTREVLIRNPSSRRFLPADAADDLTYDDREVASRSVALVLDDVGTERYRDTMATMMLRRHRDAAPTVITTNLHEHEFIAMYGARVADRLREVGRFVSCGAVSMRKAR